MSNPTNTTNFVHELLLDTCEVSIMPDRVSVSAAMTTNGEPAPGFTRMAGFEDVFPDGLTEVKDADGLLQLARDFLSSQFSESNAPAKQSAAVGILAQPVQPIGGGIASPPVKIEG